MPRRSAARTVPSSSPLVLRQLHQHQPQYLHLYQHLYLSPRSSSLVATRRRSLWTRGPLRLHLQLLHHWRYRSRRLPLQFHLHHLHLHHLRQHPTRRRVRHRHLSTHRLFRRWDGPEGTSSWRLTRMLTTTLCSRVCWRATTRSLLPPSATFVRSTSTGWRIPTGRPR